MHIDFMQRGVRSQYCLVAKGLAQDHGCCCCAGTLSPVRIYRKEQSAHARWQIPAGVGAILQGMEPTACGFLLLSGTILLQ